MKSATKILVCMLAGGLIAGCANAPERRAGCENPNYAGAIIGGLAGGVLGAQVGAGAGRTAATAVGAGTGAVVGSQVACK